MGKSPPEEAQHNGGIIVLPDLTLRVEEAQEALAAIRSGQVDALVVSRSGQDQEVVLLQGAGNAYRVLFETLNEGAIAIAAQSGFILYANRRFAELVGCSLEEVLGERLISFVPREDWKALAALLDGAREGGSKGELCLMTKSGARLPVMISARAVVEAGNVEAACTLVITDLTAIKEAQAARLASERRYRELVDTALEGFWQIDMEQRLDFVNDRMEQLLGYSAAEVRGRMFSSFVTPTERRATEESLRRIIAGERAHFDTELVRRDGSTLWVIVSGSPLRGDHAELLGALGMIKDITHRKEIENALRRREAQLLHAQELGRMGSWDWDLTSNELQWSDELIRIFGETPGRFVPTFSVLLERVHPDDRARFEEVVNRAIETGETFFHEYHIVRPDGVERIISARGHVVSTGGPLPTRMVGSARDVTDERTMERRLRAAVHEKDVLLKEAHHRVKNNLQVISSLLGLQGRQVSDPAAREMLRESESRVQTIALVHESIYQSKDLGSIDLSAYIRRLIGVVQSMYESVELLEIAVEVEPIRLGIDTAIQCGLIVHELVTNALKHAFIGRRGGRVWISMRRLSESELALEVGDDGVGLRMDVDIQKVRTLGLRLVGRLTAQIGGCIELSREGGTRFTIRFPDPGCAPSSSLPGVHLH